MHGQITDHGHFMEATQQDGFGTYTRFRAYRKDDLTWDVYREHFSAWVSAYKSYGRVADKLTKEQASAFMLAPIQ